MPRSQGVHAAPTLVPPVTLPRKPGGHDPVHVGCPGSSTKVPASQGTHVADDVAPVAELADPAAQLEHAEEPEDSAYDPAVHAKHDADEVEADVGL